MAAVLTGISEKQSTCMLQLQETHPVDNTYDSIHFVNNNCAIDCMMPHTLCAAPVDLHAAAKTITNRLEVLPALMHC